MASDLYYKLRYWKLRKIEYQPFYKTPFEGKKFVARVISVHSPNTFTAAFENLGGIDMHRMKLVDYLCPDNMSNKQVIEAKLGLEEKILDKFVKVLCTKPSHDLTPINVICYRKAENINEYMKKNYPFKESRVSELITRYNSHPFPIMKLHDKRLTR